jgi:hypothetical protein
MYLCMHLTELKFKTKYVYIPLQKYSENLGSNGYLTRIPRLSLDTPSALSVQTAMVKARSRDIQR